ncbi:acetate--CoA ligase family protein [Cytobacillus firmus]|uniref:acetate--CoA ligase family protein n=1 Tax=Cytobacillus firmus TaxID=1399 RepID=UPI002163E1F4|nr:acetate--CoA ligase family protein [Cytobacillus firmus]MCS0671342.1 acetate--CoA ligase family protein [Cytobacillus firmus]
MSKYDAIEKLLNPSSIAVVGASHNVQKHGGRLIENLLKHRYQGKIFPVNPKGGEIQGLTCYKSISDIPGTPDLACLLIAPVKLMEALRECALKNIKVVMIHASGFAETGEDGEMLQQEIVDIAREHNMRICGPNTIGIANVNNRVFASFSMAMTSSEIPMGGKIFYITQSGAIGGAMLSQGWEKKIGINKWISSGNEADLNASDYLEYAVDDTSTGTICLFLEGLEDGNSFKAGLAKAANKRKPVIVYKNGRSDIGKKSVKSHTGVLAGNHEVYKAVFKQFGAANAEDLDDLFDYAIAFDAPNKPNSSRIGIISTSGGACTIVTDQCIKYGFEVPEISSKSIKKLADMSPEFSIPQNPFDTTAQILNDPGSFKNSLQVFIEDKNIDALVLMLTTIGGEIASKVAEDIIELSKQTEKPMYVAWTIAESLAKDGMNKLREAKIPLYPSAERAVKALAAVQQHMVFLEEWEEKKGEYGSFFIASCKEEISNS